ncbi:acyl-CoA dehydrogenase family protein [Agromyces sp. MMS24-JH15]|uniref:acyl-CoA dehydrogenase family protein n=1 Tax=Agromyces sp. MMS24-JH15 TaxID=3243765 RepID=UPI00374899B0
MPTAHELTTAVRDFVRETVIPVEVAHAGVLHAGGPGGPGIPGIAGVDAVGGLPAEDRLRADLQAAARDAGLLAPHLASGPLGRRLTTLEQAAVFEAAGYSLFGPIALNIAAPDEGNLHLLERVGTAAQRERWVAPLADARIRSAFAMTEPPPGAGSDPRALRTRAERVPGGWRITGEKWFITGARGADLLICMARTSGEPGDADGATAFLVPGDCAGLEVVRDLGTVDASMAGGHGVVRFDGCLVPDDAVLGEVGGGFAAAQVRLAPARLTHCMRWLGIAGRAHDLALAHVTERRAFGARIADLGLAQQHLADDEIDLAASRALIRETARVLDAVDAGEAEAGDAGTATSIAKTFVSEAVGRVVDRAVQLAGGQGVSDELLLSRYWREVRAFRIYDGSSETHRWSIAKRAVRRFAEGGRHDLGR